MKKRTMTEPTDEELCRIWRETEGIADALRAIYRSGVASQAARIAELEGELATTTTVLGEAYAANEALKSERDTLTRELALAKHDASHWEDAHGGLREERDTLTRELAEAREERDAMAEERDQQMLRATKAEHRHETCAQELALKEQSLSLTSSDFIKIAAAAQCDPRTARALYQGKRKPAPAICAAIVGAAKQLGLPEPLQSALSQLDAHRSAKTPAGERARALEALERELQIDDGPPRVGDLVMHRKRPCTVVRIYDSDSLLVEHAGGRNQSVLTSSVTIIRRAGQPEAKASEPKPIQTSPFRSVAQDSAKPWQKADLPGGPGPNTDRLAELERKVERLEEMALMPKLRATGRELDLRQQIRAERAGKGEGQ